MKFPVIILLLLFSMQVLRENPSCEKLLLSGNMILVSAEIENTTELLRVCFGTKPSAIFEAKSAGISVPARKQLIKNHKLQNRLFSCSGDFRIVAARPKPAGGVQPIGYLGFDFLEKAATNYHLDFDNGSICSNVEDIPAFAKSKGYREIKTRFTATGFSIFAKVKWKEYEFAFDTGYTGGYSMCRNDGLPWFKDHHQTIRDSISGSDIGYYATMPVNFNGINYQPGIAVSESPGRRVGIGFIKGFNWLIDLRRKKVYVRKSSLPIDALSF
jgi:hypothetical protein